MGVNEARLSLAGLCTGDAFGASLLALKDAPRTGGDSNSGGLAARAANTYIELRTLPPAPWRWTAETQLALSVVEELEEREAIDQDSLSRRIARRYATDPERGFGPGTRQVLGRIARGEYFRSVTRTVHEDGSYGSLAASRAVPIGAYFHHHPERAIYEVRLATAITHLHPEGQAGAEAVALASVLAAEEAPPRGDDFLREIVRLLPDSLIRQKIQKSIQIPPDQVYLAAHTLGVGETNTVFDTIPFALWCSAHHMNNYEEALWMTAAGGGKRNTIYAIVGGIVALAVQTVPRFWQKRCEPLPGPIDLDRGIPLSQPGEPPGNYPQEKMDDQLKLSKEPELASIREDPLTRLPNLLGLLDWVEKHSGSEKMAPFTLVAIHFISLWDVNRKQGRTAGDELLRSSARQLQAQCPGQVFRAGGDKFIIILPNGHPDSPEVQEKIQALIQSISIQDVKEVRPPRTAVIFFGNAQYATPGYLLASLYVALADRNFKGPDNQVCVFDSSEIPNSDDFPWMMIDLADQMLRMSGTADESIRLAHTDSISQLPNMRAALNALDSAVNHARSHHQLLSVLLIDGDNLRRYNQISYDAGDEAIRLLGRTLKSQLRESDFLARWRTGDEFLIVLPGAQREMALQVGQRLCRSVEQASRAWLFPSTVSIGIALFPDQGRSVQNLLDAAEQGLEMAKQNGKNQVRIGQARH